MSEPQQAMMFVVYVNGEPRSILAAPNEELAMRAAQQVHTAGNVTLKSVFTAPLDELTRVLLLGYLETMSMFAQIAMKWDARMEAQAGARTLFGRGH